MQFLKIFLSILIVLTCTHSFGQKSKIIAGKVISEEGSIPDAYVTIGTQGGITDGNGSFKFEYQFQTIPDTLLIEVAALGYRTQKFSYPTKVVDLNELLIFLSLSPEITDETARDDIAKGKIQLLLSSGIAPVIFKSDKKFTRKYGVTYYEFGCEVISNESLSKYNSIVATYLDSKYGVKWRRIVRDDVIGINSIKEVSNKPTMKMVKEIIYKTDNGQLKNRSNLFDSNTDSYEIFDKHEKVIEVGRYNPDGSIYEKTFYVRCENGDVIKRTTENPSGDVKRRWDYVYDSNNNLIKIKTYDSDDKLIQIQSNKVDQYGNSIEMILTSVKRNSERKYTYVYNEQGDKIEQIRYEPDGSLRDRRTYSNDKNGNEIEQVQYKSDGTTMKFVSEYDKMNNLIVQQWYNQEGEKAHQTSFDYVYDDNGNWITKKRSSDGVLNMVWEREIEYYQ